MSLDDSASASAKTSKTSSKSASVAKQTSKPSTSAAAAKDKTASKAASAASATPESATSSRVQPLSPIKLPASGASADVFLRFIVLHLDAIVRPSTGVLVRNKSVTKADRDEIIQRLDAVQRASELALASGRTAPASAAAIASKESIASIGASIRDVIRGEMDKLREELVQRPEPVSYADAAKSGRQRPAVKTPVTRPAIVLQSDAPDVKTSADVVRVWKKSVSFKQQTFAPARVQHVSNGKVRVEFDNVQQRDDTLGRLASVSGLKAEPARRQRPLVVLKGVSKDVASEDVVQLLGRQNPSVQTSGDVRVRFVRRNRNPELQNVVLEVPPCVRVQMLQLGRINVDHQRVRVDDFSPFVQCYKCLGFGHTRAKCASDVQRCSHCASEGHDFASCPDKADAGKTKCHNCTASGRTSDAKHSATSAKHCPRIKAMQQRIASRTDYGA